MNKGFTLIELLAVIVLLGIIGVIAVPKIVGYTKTAKEAGYKEDVISLKRAATNYYLNNLDKVPDYGAPISYIDLKELVNNNYASSLKEECSGTFYVEYENEEKYVTQVKMTCNGKEYCSKIPCQ